MLPPDVIGSQSHLGVVDHQFHKACPRGLTVQGPALGGSFQRHPVVEALDFLVRLNNVPPVSQLEPRLAPFLFMLSHLRLNDLHIQ